MAQLSPGGAGRLRPLALLLGAPGSWCVWVPGCRGSGGDVGGGGESRRAVPEFVHWDALRSRVGEAAPAAAPAPAAPAAPAASRSARGE